MSSTETRAAQADQDRAGQDRAEQDSAEVIAAARRSIDELDQQIIALVRRRMGVSAEIQQARLSSGGRRLSLSRENEILARYREELGRPGTTLAMTLLELCRGRV